MFNGCSTETSKLVPIPDFTKLADYQDTNIELDYNPKVDMLFVIDESGSMHKHQSNLSSNIDLFVDEFLKSELVDFHIGVTCTQVVSSSYYSSARSSPYHNSYGISNRCGTLLREPPFLTNSTPRIAERLPNYLKIGVGSGGTESVFENAYKVLTSSNQTGFYREDAHLVLIFVTDAHDQSAKVDRRLLRDTLIKMKNRNSKLIHILSAIIPSYEGQSSTCQRDQSNSTPLAIEAFTNDFDGRILSLCDPDFGRQLGVAGGEIYNKVMHTIFIEKGIPIPNTIELFYGSQVVDKKYIQYNPYRNMIILSKDLELKDEPKGTKLRLKYTTADLDFEVLEEKSGK